MVHSNARAIAGARRGAPAARQGRRRTRLIRCCIAQSLQDLAVGFLADEFLVGGAMEALGPDAADDTALRLANVDNHPQVTAWLGVPEDLRFAHEPPSCGALYPVVNRVVELSKQLVIASGAKTVGVAAYPQLSFFGVRVRLASS